MKIITVVGARPQFIKAATISRAIRLRHADPRLSSPEERILHTGQHYDKNMSQRFFDELDIPRPHYNLEVSGGPQGAMTGRMLERVEQVLLDEKPDRVLVYGDTNSTLAGALAAAKLHIPVAHVEAGLRSFNRRMPEEINRILTDRISDLLFCPTETAIANLHAEGVWDGVHNVGDVMFDAALFYENMARERSNILVELGIGQQEFVLATVHRAENTDDPRRLTEILDGLALIAGETTVVLPLHPRTRKILEQHDLLRRLGAVKLLPPVSFLEMIQLEKSARAILTDSGGIQKEAFFYRTPCITLRDETEWVETIQSGWNRLVKADQREMMRAWNSLEKSGRAADQQPYGDGSAAAKIIEIIAERT